MVSQDFAPAEAFYEPAQDTLVLGLPPLFLLLLFVLLAGAGLLGWWLGGRRIGLGGGGDAERAPSEIHKAILAASSAAMAASSNDLKGKVQALHDLVEGLLGPVLIVAKGVNPPLKGLAEALKGEKKVEVKPAPPAPEPAKTPACQCGKPEACTCARPVAVGPVTVNQVYIGGAAVAQHHPCGCAGHHHRPDCSVGHGQTPPAAAPAKAETKVEPKTETQPMTGPEQIEALSKAVRQFHDHWLDGPTRIRELKAARDALSQRPPAATLKSGEDRVWDRH